MAKSLDQFEYEMQHQRFLKVLSEALYEIQDNPDLNRALFPVSATRRWSSSPSNWRRAGQVALDEAD
jgi:hypothetical protein